MKKIVCLITLVIIYFFTPHRALAIGGEIWETIVGNPGFSEIIDKPGNDLDFSVPPCNQVWEKLKEDFGVTTFSGDTNEKFTNCSILQVFYRTYGIASKSDKYYSLLKKAGPFNIRVYYRSEERCGGDVLTSNNIKLHIHRTLCMPSKGPSMLLLHETGHQIRQQTQPLILSKSKLAELWSKDPNCYNRWGFLKSYSLISTYNDSESMAEGTMLYIVNSKTDTREYGTPIRNFKSECNATYNYIGEAVYGGYEFN